MLELDYRLTICSIASISGHTIQGQIPVKPFIFYFEKDFFASLPLKQIAIVSV